MAPKNPLIKKDEVVLGIDYGGVNIGLAFGKNGLVQPLKIIGGKNESQAISDICRVVIENKVTRLVMGLPLNFDGKETAQSIVTRTFAKKLKIKSKLPLDFVNEVLTSKESVKAAIGAGVKKKGRQKIDHIAAGLILKRYYEE